MSIAWWHRFSAPTGGRTCKLAWARRVGPGYGPARDGERDDAFKAPRCLPHVPFAAGPADFAAATKPPIRQRGTYGVADQP